MDKVVWAGSLCLEGHTISYEIHNQQVVIRETMEAAFKSHNSHMTTTIDKAIAHQEKYIALGYDKI
jgi:hypothetical protein